MKDLDYCMYMYYLDELEEKKKKKKQRSEEQNNEGKIGKDQKGSSEEPLVVLDKQKQAINVEAANPEAAIEKVIDQAWVSESSGPKGVLESVDDELAEENVGTSSQQNDVAQSPSREKQPRLAIEDVEKQKNQRSEERNEGGKMGKDQEETSEEPLVLDNQQNQNDINEEAVKPAPAIDKVIDKLEISSGPEGVHDSADDKHAAKDDVGTSLQQNDDLAQSPSREKRQRLADEDVEISLDQQNDVVEAKRQDQRSEEQNEGCKMGKDQEETSEEPLVLDHQQNLNDINEETSKLGLAIGEVIDKAEIGESSGPESIYEPADEELADEEVETSLDQQNDVAEAKQQNQRYEEQNEGGKMGKDKEETSEEPLVLDHQQNQKEINEEASKAGLAIDEVIDKAEIGESSGPGSINESADQEHAAKENVGMSLQQNDEKWQRLANEDVETSLDQQNDVAEAKQQNQRSEEQSEGGKMGKDQENSSEEPLVVDHQNKQKDINEEDAKPGPAIDEVIENAEIGQSSGPESVNESADDEPGAKEAVGISRQQNDGLIQSPSHEKRQRLANEDVETSLDPRHDVAEAKRQKVVNEDVQTSIIDQQNDVAEEDVKPGPAIEDVIDKAEIGQSSGSESVNESADDEPAAKEFVGMSHQQNDGLVQSSSHEKRNRLANEDIESFVGQQNDVAEAKRQKVVNEDVKASIDQQNYVAEEKLEKLVNEDDGMSLDQQNDVVEAKRNQLDNEDVETSHDQLNPQAKMQKDGVMPLL